MSKKYKLKNGKILKYGNTILLEDVVKYLNRKSYLENFMNWYKDNMSIFTVEDSETIINRYLKSEEKILCNKRTECEFNYYGECLYEQECKFQKKSDIL